MEKLFDDRERTIEGPAKNSTDPFEYYQNSNRGEIITICSLLNSWFKDYPDDEKIELKERFKVAFDPTFFELFIYSLFTKIGYKLDVHPDVPNSNRHPDYFAANCDQQFYIEVKSITTQSQVEKGIESKKNTLLDWIDKTDATNFVLKLDEIFFLAAEQPSGKNIVKFFNQEISKYDPNDFIDLVEKHGFDVLPELEYIDEKVKIKCRLIPLPVDQRGKYSRAIAVHPTVIQIGDQSENIITALESKASRYGEINEPYIICINKQDIGLNPIEINTALYGSLETSWSTNPNNRDERLGYAGNGFFGSKSNPKHTRVSGAYFSNANPANLSSTGEQVFKHNFHAKKPMNLSMKMMICEILGVPKGYPFVS